MTRSFLNRSASLLLTTGLFLLWQGCASAPVPEGNLEVEILSDPAGLTIMYRDQSVGLTPLNLRMAGLQETALLSISGTTDKILERRIQVLGPNEVRVNFSLTDEPGPMAKALGLTDVVVFDYGHRASFEINKFDLKPELAPILDAQAQLLLGRFKALDVYVCGHTDSSGDADFNGSLSIKRAQAVADYLISQGVTAQQLQVQGFGADFPLAPNQSEAGRALNRRTEIILGDG